MNRSNINTPGGSGEPLVRQLSQTSLVLATWLVQWTVSTVAGITILLALCIMTGPSAGHYYRGPVANPPLGNLILVMLIAAACFVVPMLSATEQLHAHVSDTAKTVLAGIGLLATGTAVGFGYTLYVNNGPWNAGTIVVWAVALFGVGLGVFCFYLPRISLPFLQRFVSPLKT